VGRAYNGTKGEKILAFFGMVTFQGETIVYQTTGGKKTKIKGKDLSKREQMSPCYGEKLRWPVVSARDEEALKKKKKIIPFTHRKQTGGGEGGGKKHHQWLFG